MRNSHLSRRGDGHEHFTPGGASPSLRRGGCTRGRRVGENKHCFVTGCEITWLCGLPRHSRNVGFLNRGRRGCFFLAHTFLLSEELGGGLLLPAPPPRVAPPPQHHPARPEGRGHSAPSLQGGPMHPWRQRCTRRVQASLRDVSVSECAPRASEALGRV